MRNTLETRLGIFVALAVLAAVLILELVGGFERFSQGYRVRALFANVQDLKEGDRVKMAGVDIGRVERIRLDPTNNKVVVTLNLKTQAEVRSDSVATIKFTGLMGQNFVSIDFGSPSSPRLADSQFVITQETPDIGTMLAKIDAVAGGVENLTKSFTGDKIDNLLGPLTDFLKANSAPLTATIANINAISRQITEGQGTVGKLIYDETLHQSSLLTVTNLQEATTDIRSTLAEARKAIDQINSGQGTIGKLIHDEALYRDTTASMTQLREALEKLNQGQGSVGKLLNDPGLYNNAKLTLQKLDKATEGLEDQGPLSVIGILVNNLF
jgi:phospholipid/cholesterol/gamma-HCH transport system substrate-binding protein